MNIKEITGRNYYATKKRGQITPETTLLDFIVKISDETEELYQSWFDSKDCTDYDIKELADVVLVCFSLAKFTNKDLLQAMQEKMLYNETRTD